jgi:hypothetical protein
MKRFILSILALLTLNMANGQEKDLTFKVTNYEIDGVNRDDIALQSDVALSFYMCNDTTLCFANQWRNSNSQSYGGVFALKSRKVAETDTTYEADEIKFTWRYVNTYDSIRGQAAVTFTTIKIGNTIKFVAEILVLDTNEVLLLKGYLE